MSTAPPTPASREGGPVAQPGAAPTDSGRSSAPTDKSREEIFYPDDAGQDAKAAVETDGDPKPPTEASPPVAPVYAEGFSLTPPEGLELTPEIVAEAAPVFREIGLDSEQANKLMPLAGKVVERVLTGQEDQFLEMKRGWTAATMADPQMGGSKWPETEHLVAAALNAAGAPKGSELRHLLDQSGLGNHPAMIRAFRYFGTLVRSAPAAEPSTGAGPKTREDILYG